MSTIDRTASALSIAISLSDLISISKKASFCYSSSGVGLIISIVYSLSRFIVFKASDSGN